MNPLEQPETTQTGPATLPERQAASETFEERFSRRTGGHRHSRRSSVERNPVLFAAMVMLGLALVVALAVQCAQLLAERAGLWREYAAQTRPVEEAVQLRARLGRLARETHQLSEQGYPVGKALETELRRRGIVIDLTADPPVVHAPPQERGSRGK